MSVNLNSQNPQLLQQRLNVREQEINALKMQNRHLLSKIEGLETQAKPNQINTQFVADDVHKHLEPVIAQMQSTMTASFEILQSTMRGIYQQSQRAQQAVEEMTSQARDLEMRMNEQRKSDQNYYQDKIFSMVGAFCDRVERQIDIRLKSLSVVELMNSKQNEVLSDVEGMKSALLLMSKSSEASRGEIARIERNASEANEKLIDVQVQTGNTEELIRDTLQQVQNHRAEFKIIRSELKATLDSISKLAHKVEHAAKNVEAAVNNVEAVVSNVETAVTNVEAAVAEATEAAEAAAAEMEFMPAPTPIHVSPVQEVVTIAPTPVDETKLINDIIENKHRELEALERNIEEQSASHAGDDATMILALLRAQKTELQRVANEAKNYLKDYQPTQTVQLNPKQENTHTGDANL